MHVRLGWLYYLHVAAHKALLIPAQMSPSAPTEPGLCNTQSPRNNSRCAAMFLACILAVQAAQPAHEGALQHATDKTFATQPTSLPLGHLHQRSSHLSEAALRPLSPDYSVVVPFLGKAP